MQFQVTITLAFAPLKVNVLKFESLQRFQAQLENSHVTNHVFVYSCDRRGNLIYDSPIDELLPAGLNQQIQMAIVKYCKANGISICPF